MRCRDLYVAREIFRCSSPDLADSALCLAGHQISLPGASPNRGRSCTCAPKPN
jgi:hypothetical protein